jgi:hypothetical protein
MKNREVLTAFEISCRGVSKTINRPLSSPSIAGVTVYKDGAREVGCEMIDPKNGDCKAVQDIMKRSKCIQLFPAGQRNNKAWNLI